MIDQFDNNTNNSGSNPIVAMLIGLIAFFGSFYLLWWNEGRALHRAQFLAQEQKVTRTVTSSSINPQNNNALVHFSGIATTNQTLTDNLFGVSTVALKLERVVMMYQWQQTSHTYTVNHRAHTTYNYNKGWFPNLIRSSDFVHKTGHTNPSSMPYSNSTMVASKITVGAFTLSSTFVDQINQYNDYSLTSQNFNAINPSIKSNFQFENNEFYYGTPNNPQIGDIRVYFKVIKPLEISVVGKQKGNTLVEFFSSKSHLSLLNYGNVSLPKMFDIAATHNEEETWTIRIGGILMMMLGLRMIISPITTIMSWFGFFGNIIDTGINMIISMIAITLSLSTIALAWIFYRPLIGYSILAGAAFIALGGITLIKKRLADARRGLSGINIQQNQLQPAANTAQTPPINNQTIPIQQSTQPQPQNLTSKPEQTTEQSTTQDSDNLSKF